MTYSLHTLNSSAPARDRDAPVRYGVSRFTHEIGLIVWAALLVLWLLALLTYHAQDPAWSTTGGSLKVLNWSGRLGAWLADVSYFMLGFSVWWGVAAAVRAWLASLARWMRADEAGQPGSRWPFWLGLVLLVLASTALEWTRLYRFEGHLRGAAGGVLGYLMGPLLMKWLGFTGSALLTLTVVLIGSALVFRFSWGHAAERLGAALDSLVQSRRKKSEIAEDLAVGKRAAREREEVVHEERIEIREHHPQPVQIIEPVMIDVPKSERVVKERQKPLFTEMPDSKLPQVDLLDGALLRQETVAPETLEMTSRLIEKKLKDFGVEVRVVLASPGPVITRYEIEPATGVKGSQVVNLAKRQTIKLSEILGSQIYHEAKSLLTMGLGKDIIGNPVVADLAKMPHVLVAGTTGSGKSVGINAMFLSLLYKAEARDVRLLMIDPKMLEMSVYEGIPHLLAPVVTDMKQAANGLTWCVAEMERRYKLMSKLGVRNLAGYNTKIDEAKAREEFIYFHVSPTPESPEPLQRLPHIVVVIDELADLMMVVGKKIEELIARLAQKARAAGIHLILATQRPSVDVITGLIKANIPTRIAFQVSSKIDSRTILDQMGAEALLGMGDMLYMPSGTGFPVRVHGAFVSDEEVHRVVSYLKSQGEPDYIEGVLEGGTVDGDDGPGGEGGGEGGEKDPMYDQAVEVVLKDRKASISYVQRKLRIGYNRSARLLEDMEKAGLVSALTASGQREVLVPARNE